MTNQNVGLFSGPGGQRKVLANLVFFTRLGADQRCLGVAGSFTADINLMGGMMPAVGRLRSELTQEVTSERTSIWNSKRRARAPIELQINFRDQPIRRK